MNPILAACIVGLLLVLLALLQAWQRKIEEVHRSRALEGMREADSLGTAKPINQHPQIDEQACIGCGSCVAACPEDQVLGMVDGIAKVIHGSRCIGHGLCADACPVAAVKIGLGALAESEEIPVVDEGTLLSTVPGLYIAGELGGISLIRNAVNQGVRAVEAIHEAARADEAPADPKQVDVLIVGAGPAGFAAALKAIELGLSYAVIDQDDIGGTVRKYPRRKLTLTGAMTLPLHGRVKRLEFLKEELIELWEDIVRRFKVKIRSGVKLDALEGREGSFVARTSEGPIAARRVILAIGRRGTPRRLGVPGEEQEKVLYQLIDAATYERERILIVGGGDSAAEAAIAIASQRGNEVTLSYRRPTFFRLKKRNEERLVRFIEEGRIRPLLSSQVQTIEKDRVTIAVERDGDQAIETIQNDYVFIFAGGEPPYPLLKAMGIRFGGGAARAASRELSGAGT